MVGLVGLIFSLIGAALGTWMFYSIFLLIFRRFLSRQTAIAFATASTVVLVYLVPITYMVDNNPYAGTIFIRHTILFIPFLVLWSYRDTKKLHQVKSPPPSDVPDEIQSDTPEEIQRSKYSASKVYICSDCGHKLEDPNFNFCPHCGASFED